MADSNSSEIHGLQMLFETKKNENEISSSSLAQIEFKCNLNHFLRKIKLKKHLSAAKRLVCIFDRFTYFTEAFRLYYKTLPAVCPMYSLHLLHYSIRSFDIFLFEMGMHFAEIRPPSLPPPPPPPCYYYYRLSHPHLFFSHTYDAYVHTPTHQHVRIAFYWA